LFPWMNDSGFWIICKMSGFTERETFRNFSYLLLLMGLVGLVATMVMAALFPLV
jgi:GntP family gluconate:H+ symporter